MVLYAHPSHLAKDMGDEGVDGIDGGTGHSYPLFEPLSAGFGAQTAENNEFQIKIRYLLISHTEIGSGSSVNIERKCQQDGGRYLFNGAEGIKELCLGSKCAVGSKSAAGCTGTGWHDNIERRGSGCESGGADTGGCDTVKNRESKISVTSHQISIKFPSPFLHFHKPHCCHAPSLPPNSLHVHPSTIEHTSNTFFAPVPTIIPQPKSTLPDNSWVLDLLKCWNQPPLSYYMPVLGGVTEILLFLLQSTTTLQHLPTKPYKSKGSVSPATTLVLDDLISLKHDLVHLSSTCGPHAFFACEVHMHGSLLPVSGTGAAMESVASVLNNMFKSQLSAPFSGQQPLLSEDELKRVFLPSAHEPVPIPLSATKASLITERNKDVAQQMEYLANWGKELSFSSVLTPTGWFTDIHIDGNGMLQIMVHFEGEKLWLVWPPTEKNLIWWGINHPCPPSEVGRQPLAISALKNLEGLQLLHVTEPCTFILLPFAIHLVISFSTSTHTGASFVHETHWPLACVGLEFAKTLVSALIEEVVEQERFWLEAMGRRRRDALYLHPNPSHQNEAWEGISSGSGGGQNLGKRKGLETMYIPVKSGISAGRELRAEGRRWAQVVHPIAVVALVLWQMSPTTSQDPLYLHYGWWWWRGAMEDVLERE
ncbi:hypothetical protein C8R45DRAFT_947580 [Mycena sanguinolenta]|nr:hypothetical protein C8R45DRAFT_947580 [Mycena sanguinolenta]